MGGNGLEVGSCGRVVGVVGSCWGGRWWRWLAWSAEVASLVARRWERGGGFRLGWVGVAFGGWDVAVVGGGHHSVQQVLCRSEAPE